MPSPTTATGEPPKLRVLVTVQAVDLDDPLHGFFHDWLTRASQVFSQITVLALRVGRFSLPGNVQVVPLRPASSRSRLTVLATLWRESWRRRASYDVVFVRGDARYVLAGRWLWRLAGKRVAFWYAHYRVTREALLAGKLADALVASVRESCNHPGLRPGLLGQAIDGDRFQPTAERKPGPVRLLVLGRLSRVKRVEEVVEAFRRSGAAGNATLTIIGPATDPGYAGEIEALVAGDPSIVWQPQSIPYDQLPEVLRRYDVLVNAYEASLDKSIVEAAMSGLAVVVATHGLDPILPPDLTWLVAGDVPSRAAAIRRLVELSDSERHEIGRQLRDLCLQHHSLDSQLLRLEAVLRRIAGR
jgi:glycosyltransferase involved in cell wall biosynthesis